MADLTVRTVSDAGLKDTALAACAALGDSFLNDGKTYLKVVNGAVAAQNVIFVLPGTCDQGEAHTETVVLDASSTYYLGPFDPKFYNQPSTNKVNITYSAVVTLTIAAYKLS